MDIYCPEGVRGLRAYHINSRDRGRNHGQIRGRQNQNHDRTRDGHNGMRDGGADIHQNTYDRGYAPNHGHDPIHSCDDTGDHVRASRPKPRSIGPLRRALRFR